jgi:hypothetical protein
MENFGVIFLEPNGALVFLPLSQMIVFYFYVFFFLKFRLKLLITIFWNFFLECFDLNGDCLVVFKMGISHSR